LNLVEKLTNGCSVRINATGTQVSYKPGTHLYSSQVFILSGIIVGGKIKHECPNSRGIGYFLEGILPLAPFAKQAVTIVFTGVTNSEEDISVDLIRTVTLPILKNFGLEDIQLKVRIYL
jgi:RNA 3'-terminal phosphate cyclase-like protein